eukprot:5181477-Amphidinium_carterae.1
MLASSLNTGRTSIRATHSHTGSPCLSCQHSKTTSPLTRTHPQQLQQPLCKQRSLPGSGHCLHPLVQTFIVISFPSLWEVCLLVTRLSKTLCAGTGVAGSRTAR